MSAPFRASCKAGLSWSRSPFRNQCTEFTTILATKSVLQHPSKAGRVWNTLERSTSSRAFSPYSLNIRIIVVVASSKFLIISDAGTRRDDVPARPAPSLSHWLERMRVNVYSNAPHCHWLLGLCSPRPITFSWYVEKRKRTFFDSVSSWKPGNTREF